MGFACLVLRGHAAKRNRLIKLIKLSTLSKLYNLINLLNVLRFCAVIALVCPVPPLWALDISDSPLELYQRRTGSAGGVAINSDVPTTFSVVYRTRYNADGWSGDVLAFALDPLIADTDPDAFTEPGDDQALWRAATQMLKPGVTHDSRRIVTCGGVLTPCRGIPFRYDHLSGDQKAKLGSDLVANSPRDERARRLVDYLRGLELPEFRSRSVPLGDIVHSSPVLAGQTLFVGANDGMLHAFDVRTGDERFAYVPNLVFGHLEALGAPDYADHHRYYVDGTPYVGEVVEDLHQRGTYLVGGLGKGGRGYYSLKIGSSRRAGLGARFGAYEEIFTVDGFGEGGCEREISEMVRWEYPPAGAGHATGGGIGSDGADGDMGQDPDMGYSFGQGYVVNANAPTGIYRPVVIFGNGYISPRGSAVLYVLDASSGALIRKIDTGAGGGNGLSIPALVDVNMDQRVDFVYAGDLKGNLWKFDLRAEDPRRWGVFHGDDMNGDGVIDAADGDVPRPLFQAHGQPITGRPDVMAMHNGCFSGASGYMVVFGTGRFLGVSDRYDTSGQSIYGVWDSGDARDALGHLTERPGGRLSSGFFLARREVVEVIVQDRSVMRRLSDWVPGHASTIDGADSAGRLFGAGDEVSAGWFFDFPGENDPWGTPGERVTGSVAIRGGMAIVISFSPGSEADKRPDVSWVNILNVCGGGGVAAVGSDLLRLSRRYEGRLNAIPAFVNTTRDRFSITDGAGRIVQMAFPGETWGRIFWRHE